MSQEVRPVEELRDELRRELQAAIFGEDVTSVVDGDEHRGDFYAGEHQATALERAKAIRDLTEAYVRLGGELELPALEPPAPATPLDVDAFLGALWVSLNERREAPQFTTETLDVVVETARRLLPGGER